MMVAPTATPRNGVDPTEGQLKPAGLLLGELIETHPYCPPHGVQGCVECSGDEYRAELGLCQTHLRRNCKVCANLAEVEQATAIDWRYADLADFADLPMPEPLVNGLLYEGNITMLYGPVKTGKSRLIMALLKSLTIGGPAFCGMTLLPTKSLLYTEEPPAVVGQRVRDCQIPADNHMANQAAAIALPAADFAQEAYTACRVRDFGLLIVDTLGAFINLQDSNDYTQTGAVMGPLRQLARMLPHTAILLLHHSNKAGGDRWASALGSTALTGQADQLIKLGMQNGKHQITIGGRCGAGPFGWDEPNTITIAAHGVDLIGKAEDANDDAILTVLQAASQPITPKQIAADIDGLTVAKARVAVNRMVGSGDVREVVPPSGNRPGQYQI